MLHVFIGTDRKRAREAMHAAAQKVVKNASTLRITDASSLADLDHVLRGRGMFDAARAVFLEGVFGNEEMRGALEQSLETLARSEEHFFIYEEKLDAAAKKLLGTYVKPETFDAPKSEREDNFFALANALRAGKKKDLWVLLQREYALGKAPEMLHGSLFWAAKQMVLRPRGSAEVSRGKTLVEALAALPHESRRQGEELEYALERFVLTRV